MKMNVLVSIGAFFAGIALGFGLAPREKAGNAAAEIQTGGVAPVAASNEVQTQRADSATILPAPEGGRPVVVAEGPREPSENMAGEKAKQHGEKPKGPAEFFAKLRKENPKQYVEMTNNVMRMRTDRRAKTEEKLDFLASIDFAKYGEEAAKDHARLQELLAKQAELEESLNPLDEQASEEDRQKSFAEMLKIGSEIADLNVRERQTLFKAVADEMGCAAEDAENFVETLNDIIDATGGNFGGFGPRRGGPPPKRPEEGNGK